VVGCEDQRTRFGIGKMLRNFLPTTKRNRAHFVQLYLAVDNLTEVEPETREHRLPAGIQIKDGKFRYPSACDGVSFRGLEFPTNQVPVIEPPGKSQSRQGDQRVMDSPEQCPVFLFPRQSGKYDGYESESGSDGGKRQYSSIQGDITDHDSHS